MSSTATRRTERLIVREVEDETVVYDLDNEQVTCLDVRTAAVWQAADGRHSVGHVARKLDMSHDDVAVALVRLDEAGLLKDAAGMSRRTVLKGLGVGAAVVPLMAVMAPTAAFAKSGRVLAAQQRANSCTVSGQGREVIVDFSLSGYPAGLSVNVTITYRAQNGNTTTLAQSVTTSTTGTAVGSFTIKIQIGTAGNQSATVTTKATGITDESTSVAITSCA